MRVRADQGIGHESGLSFPTVCRARPPSQWTRRERSKDRSFPRLIKRGDAASRRSCRRRVVVVVMAVSAAILALRVRALSLPLASRLSGKSQIMRALKLTCILAPTRRAHHLFAMDHSARHNGRIPRGPAKASRERGRATAALILSSSSRGGFRSSSLCCPPGPRIPLPDVSQTGTVRASGQSVQSSCQRR
jgi:hypothetical protein